MSKVPSRAYCTSCKKQAHGKYCKKSGCSCKCQYLTEEQIKLLMTGRDDLEFPYSEESTKQFEELMESFKN